MEKKKIYKFTDAVAYPSYDGYRVRAGKKWQILDSCNLANHYQLIRQERIHRYRYPFAQWSKEEYELVVVDRPANTLNIEKFVGDVALYITRR